jgi:hypothetical protein
MGVVFDEINDEDFDKEEEQEEYDVRALPLIWSTFRRSFKFI